MANQRLVGKKIVVSAAGQGIGRASALAMLAEGAEVFATDINPKLIEGLQGIKNLHAHVLDATNGAAVKAFAEKVGTIDALFNCAGFVHHGTVLECSEADWDFSFNLNVKAQYLAIQAFLPAMLKNGGGSIINMSSVCSSAKGLPNRFVYGASKAAVVGLTKSIAADFVKQGIRCNAIAPGTVDTPSLHGRINAFADPVQARKDFIARQPMGRLATEADITPLVIFLASDESKFVTGQLMFADGGMTI